MRENTVNQCALVLVLCNMGGQYWAASQILDFAAAALFL